jgi:protein-tyrosine-phosphatase
MRILFVCTGNTCRSPMAEAIARSVAAERGLTDVTFSSAGVGAWDGSPPSDGAMLVALERGLDISGHRSRLLTGELVAGADLVLAMSESHVPRIVALGGEGKTHLLTEFASRDAGARSVSDPFGGDLEVYRHTFDELEREVRRALDRMPHGTPDTP